MSGNDARAVAAAAAKKVAAKRVRAGATVTKESAKVAKAIDAEQPAQAEKAAAGTTFSGDLPRSERRILLPLGAAAVALLVAVIVVGLLNVRHDQKADAVDAAQKVVVAHVTQLLSYSPSSVTSDLAKEGAWLTGDFADEYATLVKSTVGPAVERGGVSAAASVVARGVDETSRDRVTMLLFVNLNTSRTGGGEAVTQGSRVRVVADKVDGKWLISELKPL